MNKKPPQRGVRVIFRKWWHESERTLLPLLFSEQATLDLRFVGRMLFHAAIVGIAAGLLGAAFLLAIEYTQQLLLVDLAGYLPLRAHGEPDIHSHTVPVFRPWVLVLLPAVGGLLCGLLTRLAPEVQGGGADAMIEAFHQRAGIVRRRVIWLKWLASLCTLGTGGAGGREGPTMLIGGALGSAVARILQVSKRERRILLVAGVAAGISAVFRTPLGAALLAVEVLYRDGFESDALIPSVLSSVVAYSVVISLFGESTLFSHAARFPFFPAHLWLFALLALAIALVAAIFLRCFRTVRALFTRLPGPAWVRPAIGGLLLGIFSVPIIILVGSRIHQPGQGLGILGGGYGAVQMAISGAPWLPQGWSSVWLLVLLSMAKLVSSSLTIGSGGSAGDFAPSLAIGGLFGGAFGRAAQLILQDPRIDPGAFALVGMGVFYGGIAHVPLSALVLVCELAGNYDLLVPLMLAQGIAFVALRKRTLYEAQVPTLRDSPVHQEAPLLDLLKSFRVDGLVNLQSSYITLRPGTSASDLIRQTAKETVQTVFPVVNAENVVIGLISADDLRLLATQGEDTQWLVAADLMQPLVTVDPSDNLRTAAERMLTSGLRELPVVDGTRHIVGYLNETDIAETYLRATIRSDTVSSADRSNETWTAADSSPNRD